MFDDLSRQQQSPFETDLDDRFLDEILAEDARSLPTNQSVVVRPHTTAARSSTYSDASVLTELPAEEEERIFGMTSWQRLFIAFMFFLNILVLSIFCLLTTGVIQFR